MRLSWKKYINMIDLKLQKQHNKKFDIKHINKVLISKIRLIHTYLINKMSMNIFN